MTRTNRETIFTFRSPTPSVRTHHRSALGSWPTPAKVPGSISCATHCSTPGHALLTVIIYESTFLPAVKMYAFILFRKLSNLCFFMLCRPLLFMQAYFYRTAIAGRLGLLLLSRLFRKSGTHPLCDLRRDLGDTPAKVPRPTRPQKSTHIIQCVARLERPSQTTRGVTPNHWTARLLRWVSGHVKTWLE